MVDSPEYDCQLVLVTNDAAVFHAVSARTPGKPRDNGRCPCTRWNTYRKSTETAEKASTLRR